MRTLSRKMTLLLIGAALTGCLANSTTSRSSRGKPAPAVNKPAPDISGIDAERKIFQLRDYRGKVVLLDFWGSH